MNRKRRSPIWKIDTNKLKEMVSASVTFTELLKNFGLHHKGGNCRTLKARLEFEGIDYCDLLNRGRRRGNYTSKVDIKEYLVLNCNYNRYHLKKRLIKDGLLKNECSKCGQQSEWQSEPLKMVLDHINGVSNDNRLENLRLLCPNCNSQTPTFCGRNKRLVWNCKDCGKVLEKCRQKCDDCLQLQKRSPKLMLRRVERPSKEELKELLWSKPTTQIAKDYGVSGNAIARWAKSYNLTKPPRGYWGFK